MDPQDHEQAPPGAQGSRLGAKRAGVAAGDVARTAGRGFLLITAAKLWFMVMGAVINIGLPIVMSPEDFGVYSIVINAVSLVNMVVVTGTTQAVAKLISERPEAAGRLLGRALLLQLVVGVPLALAYTGAAPWIAASFNDAALTPAIQLSGGVMLAYTFYAVAVGYFNGLKAFGAQAALDVTFSTLKSAGILLAVLLGWGVMGAIGAFVAAALLIALISWAAALRAVRAAPPSTGAALDLGASTRKLLSYLLLVMLFTFGVNGVLRMDLFTLKALVEAAPASGINADQLSGIYAAMQNVSRLPYQAVIAVTAVVFPMISRSTFENDKAATSAYIQSTLRYSLLMLSGLGVLLAGNAREIILALYGTSYLAGEWPLAALSLATVGFALFFISTSMVTGAGHPVASVLLSALTLAVTVGLNAAVLSWMLNSGAVAPHALLLAASLATAAAMLVGFVATAAYLVRRHSAGLPWKTALRTAAASAAVMVPSALLGLPGVEGRWGNLAIFGAKGLLGALVFGAVLWLSGEVNSADLGRFKAVLQRRKA